MQGIHDNYGIMFSRIVAYAGFDYAGQCGYDHQYGLLINFIGSLVINVLLLFAGKWICALFGADKDMMEFAVKDMPMFAWRFWLIPL